MRLKERPDNRSRAVHVLFPLGAALLNAATAGLALRLIGVAAEVRTAVFLAVFLGVLFYGLVEVDERQRRGAG